MAGLGLSVEKSAVVTSSDDTILSPPASEGYERLEGPKNGRRRTAWPGDRTGSAIPLKPEYSYEASLYE